MLAEALLVSGEARCLCYKTLWEPWEMLGLHIIIHLKCTSLTVLVALDVDFSSQCFTLLCPPTQLHF